MTPRRLTLGDNYSITVPMRILGRAFTPESGYQLIFTAKLDPLHADSSAVIQKKTGGFGITISGSNAIISILPIDTSTLAGDIVLYCDIQAQSLSDSSDVKTVATFKFDTIRDITRLTDTSIDIYTSQPPAVVYIQHEARAASFTATANYQYTVTATATVTDPSTPVSGNRFSVFVRGGTATVGGVAYAAAGTLIIRSYASGAWTNEVFIDTDQITSQVSAAQTAAQTYADGLVVGLLDDRGNWDASVNTYPTTGGSGTAGAIKKGDVYRVSVAGTVNAVVLEVGDMVRALVDAAASTTDASWAVTNFSGEFVATNDSRLTDERVPTAAGIAAKINAATSKPTLVDADEFGLWDSITGLWRKVSSLEFWTNYLQPKADALYVALTGAQTVAGAKTLSGQLQLTGQAATDSNSAVNLEIGDARYGQSLYGYASSVQDVTNSSALTDSTDLTISLEVGTYIFETLELVGSSAFATAGNKSALVFTGTGTMTGVALRAGANNVEPVNVTPSWGGTVQSVNATLAWGSQSAIANRRGRIVVTVAGTLKVQFAQNTAVAAHYARMHVGSYIRAKKLP